jgi:hypothetical protein
VGAQRVDGPWLSVRKLIELFVGMGCELHEIPGQLVEPGVRRNIRYLYSPDANDFVSLRDLEDDDRLPPSEVENWERRLGMTIPKGPNH